VVPDEADRGIGKLCPLAAGLRSAFTTQVARVLFDAQKKSRGTRPRLE